MRAYLKELFRTFTGSISRFLSIVVIVALGVFFFIGIRATSPDMKETAGQYIEAQDIFDVHIFSIYGFNQEDVDKIKSVMGVSQVDATYSIDMICKAEDASYILTVLQLPEQNELNQPMLLEGRMPEAENECVVDSVFLDKHSFAIGDTITLSSDQSDEQDQKGQLKISSFKIVGSVTSPLYLSLLDRGTSNLGSGKVSGFVLVDKAVFDLDAYTDIYISAKDTKGQSALYREYADSLEPLVVSLKTLSEDRAWVRFNEIKAEAQQKIDDAKKEVADARKELADAKKKLLDAQKEIDKGEAELESATKEYNSQIEKAQVQLDSAYLQLLDAKAQIDETQVQLDEQKALAQEGMQQIEASLSQIDEQLIELELQKPYMTQEQYDAALLQLTESQSTLLLQKAALEESLAQITAGYEQLAAAQETYEAGKSEYEANLAAFKKEKDEGAAQLKSAKETLEKAKKELVRGQEEFAEKSAEAEEEIADAEDKIADGQKKIDDLIDPKWYVLSAAENPGIQSYIQDTERLSSIGDVFPVLFFLVAALVCLTVMTRMVEEDRMKIGTLKAIGYSNGEILAKYLIYSFCASLTGSLIGALIGFDVLPKVISKAYSALYSLPEVITPVRIVPLLEATTFSVVATVLPALFVCLKELGHMPAMLMRPKAPKAGKRILLEHVPFIWKRLSFTRKVTLRNIFRYKSRFIMTLLGIAGCTMLLVTGFGLNDSISGVVKISFGEIIKYDGLVTLSKTNDLNSVLSSDDRISRYVYTHREAVDVKRDQKEEEDVQLVATKGDITPFISLHSEDKKQQLVLGDAGAVITSRLSELLGVHVGDTITLSSPDDERSANVTITGISENYFGHYVYMSQRSYESAFGIEPQTNTAMILIADKQANEESLSEYLLSKGALNISLSSSVIKTFDESIGNIIYVVFVLILSAAALAFVVLFSLTSINIEERVRELATIKVLGFYDREVSSYVYRENILLTIMGALLGLVFGFFMHRYVISTMEKDIMKFTRFVAPQSYLYSFLLTIAFAVIVNLVMNRRLKKIDMVESLKSTE